MCEAPTPLVCHSNDQESEANFARDQLLLSVPVLQLTIFISLILAAVFVVCFTLEILRNKGRGTDRSALLPLLEDEDQENSLHSTKSKDSQ